MCDTVSSCSQTNMATCLSGGGGVCGTVSSCSQTWRRVCLVVVVVCDTVSSCSQTNMATCRNWISIERFKLCLVSYLGGVFYVPVYLDL